MFGFSATELLILAVVAICGFLLAIGGLAIAFLVIGSDRKSEKDQPPRAGYD